MSFEATHRVTAATPTWASPDRSQPPGPELYAGLEVQVVEQQGDLTKILCDNGWEAWTDAGAVTPLVAAPTGPPPAPAPTAAPAPPPPPVAAAPAPAAALPAPNARPAWMVPAAIAAVVVVLIGIFVMQGGDDNQPVATGGGGETVQTTSKPKNVAFTKDSFPSTADFATSLPATWKLRELCTGGATGGLTGGEDCSEDVDDFNFVCGDEFLGGTESQELGIERPVQRGEARISTAVVDEGDPDVSVRIDLRLYKTESGAEEALDEVQGYYDGVCSESEDSTSTYAKLAASETDLGDDYIAYSAIDKGSSSSGDDDEVWVRIGTVLVHLGVSHEERLPATFYRDITQSIAARTADLSG